MNLTAHPLEEFLSALHFDLVVFFSPHVQGIRSNPPQPNLPPIGIDTPGTEQAALTVPGLANNRIQDDAGGFHLLHSSRFIVNDFSDTLEHSVGPAAVWNLFGIKVQTAISVASVQSL
jgi:hypothetical protein